MTKKAIIQNEENGAPVAAVIFEPIQAEGGDISCLDGLLLFVL